MAYIMVDVEADGPIPGDYSMVCLGAVLVKEGLDKTFYGRLRPISDKWVPDALAVSGFTREETLAFDDPKRVMEGFAGWLKESVKGRPYFVSDNNGFDWQFVNWYFWHVRAFQHQPRLAVQGAGARYVPELQTPAPDAVHPPSR